MKASTLSDATFGNSGPYDLVPLCRRAENWVRQFETWRRHSPRIELAIYEHSCVQLEGAYGFLRSEHDLLNPFELNSTWYRGHVEEYLAQYPSASNAKDIVLVDRPVLSLLWPGIYTYGHWLLDVIPRLYLALQHFGPTVFELDVLLPATLPQFARNILSDLGFKNHYSVVNDVRYSFESLFVPSHTRNLLTFPVDFHKAAIAWAKPRLTSSATEEIVPKNSKYYVVHTTMTSEHDPRQLKNNVEIEKLLEARNFNVFNPLKFSIPQQIHNFSQATCCIGVDSSAMHNLIFASQRCDQVILSSPSRMNYVHLLVSSITNSSTYVLVGDPQEESGGFSVPADTLFAATRFL